MDLDIVIYLTRQALFLAILISAPAILTALAVGFIMNILQSVTQISEPTLHFVPRIIGVFVVLVLCGPWILNEVTTFASHLFIDFPLLVP